MIVQRFKNVGEFYERIKPMLVQHEAENNFMLGFTADLRNEPANPEHFFLAVMDGPNVIAAALRTPPWPLSVTRASDAAMHSIAEWSHLNDADLYEISGPTAAAHCCGAQLAALRGKQVNVRGMMRIMQLRRIVPPKPVAGSMRVATNDDLDLICNWMEAFGKEINEIHATPRSKFARRVERKQFYLWEDGCSVSIGGSTRQTPSGICINAVYTPPEFRGRGYASNLVAALSQTMFDQGREFCFLYTDAANPISNKIYERIGYEFVCDWANLQVVSFD